VVAAAGLPPSVTMTSDTVSVPPIDIRVNEVRRRG
jgi:hypothetical protein